MKAFLREVAEELHRSFGENLGELCLVFPNRRAGLFFNKYLGDRLEHPVWSPSIYTIQDLMARISELDYADELELISLLYKVYLEVRGSEDSFDEFFFWGEIMLSDFDELDKYMVNAEDIFRNLSDLKDLEKSFDYLSEQQVELIQRFWSSFSYEQLSEQKQQFLEIWNLLFPVYLKFRESLLASGIGYEGMIYRNVAEIIREEKLSDLPFTKLIFIGFNALNPCEQLLFKSLEKSDKALFYWDYDEYYLGNEMHEAGHFMRENLSRFKDSGKSFNQLNLTGTPKEITVYSIPSDAGQAQLVNTILEKTQKLAELGEETAIVLADEELLIPVLNALPPELSEINVTMGYPVSATPVFSLIEHLIALQRNLRESKGNDPRFYHEDVLPILQHQYISLREHGDSVSKVREIHEHNLIYINQSQLAMNDLFRGIFKKIEKPEDIAGYLLEILEMITGRDDEKKPVPAMELEFIYRIYTRIQRLKDVLGRLGMNFNLPTFLRLFHKFLQRTRIPFTGEPLAGIQVMGVLETRVLDFDRIILLSMNEGSFPKTGNIQSFIPQNLRFGFQLPTPEYQDAIYAYYFYRLIQRAGDVCLLYNNKAEGLNSGEKSRFIHQLNYDPNFDVRELSAGFDVQAHPIQTIRVDKSPEVLQKLMKYSPSKEEGKGYLSPSALNSYIDCSLKFYFNYIAEIKEPVKLQEEVDPALFGTLLHEAVRSLYMKLDNPVNEADLKRILDTPAMIFESIDKAFSEIYLNDTGESPEGRNRVIREIIFTYVQKILEKDMEFAPLHIESLEESYFMEIPVQSGMQEFPVRIGGKIDRIDRLGNSYRVLDYKTGKGRMFLNSLEELFDQENKTRNTAAFQTFLYAKLFRTKERLENLPVTPGVYLIRDIFGQGFRYHFSLGSLKSNTAIWDYSSIDEEFTDQLTSLLNSLFDPGTAFVQTEEEGTCRNCIYKGICQR